jgi:hypothetical protein
MSEEMKTGLVKAAETRLPKFVEDAYESIEKMEKFAQILLDSKLVPNHFYEQLPDKKPDFTKGKVSAVVVVLIQGSQLQLPPLTALQHIIPVNGLLSIKGDLAKSMIFNSGKLKPGSWKEEEFGSIEENNLVVKITATRSDNGQTLTRSFSVEQAKRAGLWITESQVNGQDGWKFKSSAWWKYPARMINYRALGFLARDMFPDVLAGIYTTEEAMDMPADQTLVIDQGGGVTLQIPDKGFAEERSKQIAGRAVTKIENKNFAPVPEPVHTVKKEEFITGNTRGSVEVFEGEVIHRDEETMADTSVIPTFTEHTIKEMEEMPTEKLLELVNTNMDMIEAMMTIPGKNTNKKLREIVWAFQQGKLAEHVAPHIKDAEQTTEEPPKHFDEANDNAGVNDIAPNKNFDKEPELIKPKTSELNSAGIDIPAFNKGNERDFVAMKELYFNLGTVKPQINNERFLELQPGIEGFVKFKNKEDFCKYATIDEVLVLLRENNISL